MKPLLLLIVCTCFSTISYSQNVGINITNPGFPLSFPSTTGDKISLWGNSGNHYGLGIQNNLFQIHTEAANSDIVFGHGMSSIFNEVMRIKGNGNVGIGVTEPTYLLDIAGRMRLRNSNQGTAGIYFNKTDNSSMTSFIGTYDDNHLGIYGENGAAWNFFMNATNGNTGIGTIPQAKLHIHTNADLNNGLLITGTHNGFGGSIPDLDAGSRMMFYPGKAAFRAGNAIGAEWNNASVGFYSNAMGYATTASGSSSTAIGSSTIASGLASTAMGGSTTASGRYSTSMGLGTKSKNYCGITIGIYNDSTNLGSATSIDGFNRLFQIGNGTSNTSRSNAMTVIHSGYIGIGTTSPEQILDVADRIRLRSGPQGTAGLWLSKPDNSNVAGFIGTYSDNYIGMYGNGAGWGLFMNISNGNVGIGTDNPTYKLAVNGSIRSKEIRVESGWADFVFEKNYKLLSLNEVESFIIKNKRLPGIPSAKEIREDGLALGELQTKMMQKIEELTLYLIEANKKIELLEKVIGEKK